MESEDIFGRASSAVGMLVGLSQNNEHIARTRVKVVASTLVKTIPECDDRCAKNYAILMSLAEKVLSNGVLIYNGLKLKCGNLYIQHSLTFSTNNSVFVLLPQLWE